MMIKAALLIFLCAVFVQNEISGAEVDPRIGYELSKIVQEHKASRLPSRARVYAQVLTQLANYVDAMISKWEHEASVISGGKADASYLTELKRQLSEWEAKTAAVSKQDDEIIKGAAHIHKLYNDFVKKL